MDGWSRATTKFQVVSIHVSRGDEGLGQLFLKTFQETGSMLGEICLVFPSREEKWE